MQILKNKSFGSIGVYLMSVLGAYGVVELLRISTVGQQGAAKYIEWIALSIVIASSFELGISSRIHWSLLSCRTSGMISYSNNKLVTGNIKSRIGNLKAAIYWIIELIKLDFNKGRVVKSILISVLLIIVLLSVNQYNLQFLLILCLIVLSILTNIRKIGCGLLEGGGLFVLSRIFQALPAVLTALYILILIIINKEIEDVESVIVAVTYFNIVNIVLMLCVLSKEEFLKNLPDPNLIVSKTTSSDWHILSIAISLQHQIFYILAPIFGLSAYTVIFYYGQKAAHVFAEVVAQILKEKLTSKIWGRTGNSNEVVLRSLMLAFIPAIGAIVAMNIGKSSVIQIFSFTLILFVLDVYISGFTNLLCHAALYKGAIVPVYAHVLNSGVQVPLVLALTSSLGVMGFPTALLVAGCISSYSANILLFKRTK